MPQSPNGPASVALSSAAGPGWRQVPDDLADVGGNAKT